VIDVEDLTVSRGGQTVLDGVSLSASAGELVGVVGPNGAGKTTLLHTINGVLDPDAGTVRLRGQRIDELQARETARLAATVRQDTSVGFEFTVEQIVEMGRTPYHGRFGSGDDDGRAMVERALERTDTTRFADRPIGTVSGGQRQRVLLARALAQDTPVLLLDEPTASLDVNHQVRTLELVEDVVAGGKTAIAAIHDLDLAARFCDRLVLLSGGRVLASGTPADVLDAEQVSDAYETRAAVATDPITGTPTVRALRRRPDRDGHAHVIGGGPLGSRVIEQLDGNGLTVTAGPLPAGDVAAETAQARDLGCVTAPPFEQLDSATRERVQRSVATADVTVVIPDLLDAEVVRALVDERLPVVVLAPDGVVDGWLATATVVTTVEDLVSAVLEGAVESPVRADD
jgi:iron complex transport system ATP-binding protein